MDVNMSKRQECFTLKQNKSLQPQLGNWCESETHSHRLPAFSRRWENVHKCFLAFPVHRVNHCPTSEERNACVAKLGWGKQNRHRMVWHQTQPFPLILGFGFFFFKNSSATEDFLRITQETQTHSALASLLHYVFIIWNFLRTFIKSII